MLNTPYREGIAIPLIVAAGVMITEGELVATNSDGHAVPASDANANYLMGRAESTVETDDAQTNAAITVTRNRQFLLSNDATNPVTTADIGKVVVLNGKNTVAKPVEGGSADALGVGVLMGVDYSGKVWVDVSGTPIGIVAGAAAATGGDL